MFRRVVLCMLVLTAAVPVPSATAASAWTVLVEDASHDAHRSGSGGASVAPVTDARADLVRVEARELDGAIALRLTTRDAGVVPGGANGTRYESTLRFTVTRGGVGGYESFTLTARDDDWSLERAGGGRIEGALDVPADARPENYTVTVHRWALFADGEYASGDRVTHVQAALRADGPDGSVTDHAPDYGATGNLELERGMPGAPSWKSVEGPDFAAGPSVAVSPDGGVHVAFIVYNDDRGERKGLYHGVVDEDRLRTTRIADARMPTELHEDRNTQTAIAVDGEGDVHVAFHPHPSTGEGAVRYATNAGGKWRVEDPSAGLPVESGKRGNPALAAHAGRVVLAFQRADAESVTMVERTGEDAWRVVHTLRDARHARVALDADGGVHVAWFEPERDESPDRSVFGNLRYASEASGWRARTIAEDVEDRSKFWDTASTDGSFAFALGPNDAPHFVWESERGARHFAVLRADALEVSSSPLTPVHGNPQLRMRLAVDAAGTAHVASGYGGLDLYGARSATGGWYRENADRLEAFSLAVHPDGLAVLVGTQPHGGTTLEVQVQYAAADVPPATDATGSGAGPQGFRTPGAGALAACAVLALLGRFVRGRT